MRRALLPVVAGFTAIVLAVAALAVAALVTAPPAAANGGPAPAVTAADSWLRDQLQPDGGFELAQFPGFETPDAILAVATAAQTGATWNATTARDAVAAVTADDRSPLGWADDWVDGEFGGFGAGQAAKLIALVAAPLGIDPRDFDPDDDSPSAVDLVATMDAGRALNGSLATCNATLFALIADNALRRRPNAATVAYVKAAQKTNGTWDFACDPSGSGVDVDTTAYAVLGLVAAGEATSSPAVTAAVRAFAEAMLPDGGWGDDYGSGPEVNPNSTALATAALSAAGRDVRTRAWRDAAAPTRIGESYVDPAVSLAALQELDGRIAGPFDGFGINTFATSQAVQGLTVGRAASWWPQRPSRPVATAGRWTHATLDGSGGPGRVTADAPPSPDGVGEDASSVLFGGAPHVFYYDRLNGDLRHAWWTGTAWAFETLDGDNSVGGRVDGDVGSGTTALLWAGTPHVFYDDRSGGNLRHAWWTGRRWAYETLDGDSTAGGRVASALGTGSSVAVFGGTPHVWYHDRDAGTLRHAWWTGRRWAYETLDGDGTTGGRVAGSVGATSSVVVWGGGPHVFYDDATNGDLRHAWWTGRRWAYETLDGDGTAGGRVDADVATASSSVVFADLPHVFYGDATNGDLRHAWWTGRRWAYETLDGDGGTAGRLVGDTATTSTTVLYNGRPHVFYAERTGGDLRHAWWTGAAWAFETLDGVGDDLLAARGRIVADVGRTQTALQFGRQLQVWYLDANAPADAGGRLRHAWWSPTAPDV